MKNAIYILIFSCFLSTQNIDAQSPFWNWAKAGVALGESQATAIMVDSFGNVFAGGFYTGSDIIFQNDTLPGGQGARMFLNKYSKNGQLLWSRSSNSDVSYGWSVTPYSIKMDSRDYIYVAGQVNTRKIVWGNDSTDAGCGKDFVAKFDPQGNPIWGRFATSRGYDEAKSIALDANGNIYMLGDFYGENVGFGADSFYNHNSNGGYDLLLIKYDSSGHWLWGKSFGGNRNDYAQTISIDKSGNLFIQGYFESDSITFGNYTLSNSDTGQHANIYLVKLDANGNAIWARSNSGISNCNSSSAAMDANGNIYVTGTFGNDMYGYPVWGTSKVTFANITLTDSFRFSKLFLVKYNTNGDVIWAKLPVKMYSQYGTAYSVAVDNIGNIYMCGDFRDSSINNGPDTLASNTFGNLFFAKYDSMGNPLWLKNIGGIYLDASCVITSGADDNVCIAAGINGPRLIFDSTILTIDSNGLRTPIIARLGHDAKLTGIMSENSNMDPVLFISPNPIENNALVRYSIPGDTKVAKLVTYDILGRIRGSIKLNGKEGLININSDDLTKGLYFYSLEIDGSISTTRKIVVEK